MLSAEASDTGLVREARVGGQPADETESGGGTDRWRPAQGQCRMHQRGDGEASDQVDDERAVGEGTTESLCRPQRDQIASGRAGGACEADPKQTFRAVSPFSEAPRRG